MAAGGNLLQKAAANRGLSGADVAGEQHKAPAGAAGRAVRCGHACDARHACDAIKQMGQRLPVALAHEKIARIGRDGKRILRQAEMVRVHGSEA